MWKVTQISQNRHHGTKAKQLVTSIQNQTLEQVTKAKHLNCNK